MIFEESLLKALEDCGTAPFSQIVWRVTIGGQHALRPNVRGARWNPPETAALYTSLDEITARAEWEYLVEMQPVRPRGDLVISRIAVGLKSVIDLADPEILRREFGSLRRSQAVNLVIFTANVTADEGHYELA
jgi:RES domain-containing protein